MSIWRSAAWRLVRRLAGRAVAVALVALPLAMAAASAPAKTVVNQARGVHETRGGLASVLSNEVVAETVARATLRFFTDSSHGQEASAVGLGRPLYLKAEAAGCNRDPSAVEQIRIMMQSATLQRQSEVVAIETAANSGIFHAVWQSQPMEGATTTQAVAALPDDRLQAWLDGCAGGAMVQASVLIDPSGIVFSSDDDRPIAGAVVTLLDVDGLGNGGVAGGPARVFDFDGVAPWPSTQTTGADGRFQFPLVAPSRYRLQVEPPSGWQGPSTRPPDSFPTRTIDPRGSYGGVFEVSVATGAVTLDLPLDPRPLGLFVRLTSSRSVVEIGETVALTLSVRNVGDLPLDPLLALVLPRGFAFVPGSATLDGARTADPAGGRGPALEAALGPLAPGATRTLMLRVRVGSAAIGGDGWLRASARAALPRPVMSNLASAQIKTVAGVFADQTLVLGKVFADCDGNGLQDAGEPGVPGVRLLLEDGTQVTTDGRGQFSLYGLAPKTHVLTLDTTTLPAGLQPLAAGQRHAGVGRSRFVDPRRGELQRSDFALAGCGAEVDAAIAARRRSHRALEQALQPDFSVDGSAAPTGDARARPASGVVGEDTEGGRAAAASMVSAVPATPTTITPTTITPQTPAMPRPAGAATLAERLAAAEPVLALLDLHDAAVLPAAVATLRATGPAGAQLALEVDGQPVDEARAGSRALDEARGLQAREWVGVALAPGERRLALVARDVGGNERERVVLQLRVPGEAARLRFVLPAGPHPADGSTLLPVRLELRDAAGLPVATRTPLTLDATLGRWSVPDLDPREPGVQTFIEGGAVQLALQTPGQAGEAVLRARSGTLADDATLHFVPALRPLVASGLVEGLLNLRRLDPRAIRVASAADGFETELRRFAVGGDTSAHGRAALYLKGQVRGDVLLTLAYDSDKDGRERLFRDIQPDQFYPLYGDASLKSFDAQSTGRLYVKVEQGRSSLLLGDFTTGGPATARQLGRVQRSLNGAKAHAELGALKLDGWAARTASRQVVVELPGNGTSGPYPLSVPGLLVNSEKLELLVRDRSQPARVLRATPLQRFVDYELEPLSGRVLLRAPLASLDVDLNPQSLRIVYEAEQGGPSAWVGGAELQWRAVPGLELGAAVAVDRMPLDPSRIASASATLALAERSIATVELARVERPSSSGRGDAGRIEWRHEDGRLALQAHAARSDLAFVNPSATLGAGRDDAGVRASLVLDDRTRLLAEAVHTADRASGARRDGVQAGVERSLDGGLKLEAGLRHIDDHPGLAVAALPGESARRTDSVRAKLSAPLPGLPNATAFGEIAQDLRAADRRLVALGGDWKLADGTRLYARHELVSSLAGPLSLELAQRRQATLLGVEAAGTAELRSYGEYRLRDGLNGRDGEAAIGLRRQWAVVEGLRVDGGFERVQALSGSAAGENTALTGGLAWTRSPNSKVSARLEWRLGAASRSLLATSGAALRIDERWTALARQASLRQSGAGGSKPAQDRLQLGAAFRDDTRNLANALLRVEWRRERGTGDVEQRSVRIASGHADWRVDRALTLTGQLAAKQVDERWAGAAASGSAQLLALRATRDLGERWDLGAALRLLTDGRLSRRAGGIGLEAGYRVANNLWLSAGVNLSGFRDRDLAADDTTARGAYLRLRFKFDETLFDARDAAAGEGETR